MLNNQPKTILFSRKLLFLLFSLVFVAFFLTPSSVFSQKRIILHQPEASLKMPELARRFHPLTAKYSIELHPGWLKKESFDSAFRWTSLLCLNPKDTEQEFIRIESLPSDKNSFDTTHWSDMKDALRDQYGKQEIGTIVLFDSTYLKDHPNGILARYEILANNKNYLTYLSSIITENETLMITVRLSPDESSDRIPYFRSLVAHLKSE